MIIQEIRQQYQKIIAKKNLTTTELDLLLQYIINKSPEFILAHPEYTLSSKQQYQWTKYLNRLLQQEPIDYITGQREFYGLNFSINKNTLIPRPETEMLVESSLKIANNNPQAKISYLDIGTGSGNIIISIAKNTPPKQTNCKFYASDISSSALKIAQKNALRHQTQILFQQGPFLKPWQKKHFFTNDLQKNKIDILVIIANLPYLSQKIYNQTSDKVKKYEPINALLSGIDGLQHYRIFLQEINSLTNLPPQTFIFLEISPEQKTALFQEIPLLLSNHLPKTNVQKDLSGKYRLVTIKLTENCP